MSDIMDKIHKHVVGIAQERMIILEGFAKLYLEQTGLQPSEIVMIEQRDNMDFKWWFEPKEKEKILDARSVEVLDIPIRLYYVLLRNKIKHIWQLKELLKTTEIPIGTTPKFRMKGLFRLAGFGAKSLEQIKDALAKLEEK